MKDLVQRLRDEAPKVGEPENVWCSVHAKDLREAADLIESQAAEIAKLTAERDALRAALTDLCRGYVNTLENGRDRIRMLGGECDDVPRMEASDPHLRAARTALAARAQEQKDE